MFRTSEGLKSADCFRLRVVKDHQAVCIDLLPPPNRKNRELPAGR